MQWWVLLHTGHLHALPSVHCWGHMHVRHSLPAVCLQVFMSMKASYMTGEAAVIDGGMTC